jgi:hypothetical protein
MLVFDDVGPELTPEQIQKLLEWRMGGPLAGKVWQGPYHEDDWMRDLIEVRDELAKRRMPDDSVEQVLSARERFDIPVVDFKTADEGEG